MARVMVFDVNETLLDLSVLDERFVDVFGTADLRAEWFARLLHLSTTMSVVGRYEPFSALAGEALGAVATAHGRELAADDRDHIMGRMRSLPPHAEVQEGLAILADAGFRLAALTNSGLDAAQSVLAQAGLADAFTEILSVDAVGTFKPRPEPYRHAAAVLGVDIAEVRLVAAHDWDCAGALAAGAAAAFIARPGQSYASTLPAPDLRADDLVALARTIVDRDEPA